MHKSNHGNYREKAFSVVFLCAMCLFGPSLMVAQIHLDENIADWSGDDVSEFIDDPGDGENGLDLRRASFYDSERYLFILIESAEAFNIQESNQLQLILDVDGDPSTGLDTDGLGADLVFDFGERSGLVYRSGTSSLVFHEDIGLFTSPTVSSSSFEIALDKSDLISLGLMFHDNITAVLKGGLFGGDRLPDTGVMRHILRSHVSQNEISIGVDPAADFRLMSYNLLRDNVFKSTSARNAFGRILNATTPDIIAIQEVYDYSAAEMAVLVTEVYPPQLGESWYFGKVNPDIIVISRFPITEIDPVDGNGLFKIEVNDTELLIANLHLPCCENDRGRQQEIDRLLSRIRDILNGNGVMNLEEGSPIIITGDLNLVGDQSVQQSLITGDISDNANYGPDFLPDWKQDVLRDAIPATSGHPSSYTWYNGSSSFFPGRLDYVIYTPSSLSMESSFAFETSYLPQDTLISRSLFRADASIVSDHLAVVADFAVDGLTSVKNEAEDLLHAHYADGQLRIESHIRGQMDLFSPEGKRVFSTEMQDGFMRYDTAHLPKGLYYVRFISEDKISQTRKIALY